MCVCHPVLRHCQHYIKEVCEQTLTNSFADTTDRFPEQDQVHQEPDEHHRPAGHPALLRQHRPRQLDGRGAAHRGPENRAVLQNHADSQVKQLTFIVKGWSITPRSRASRKTTDIQSNMINATYLTN